MIIYLVGFMGSGKSTLGRHLAKYLNYKFIDLDAFFVSKEKIKIHEFFEKYGESAFRKTEYELLRQIDLSNNLIVATGGGTPCFSDNMDYMRKTGITVFLQLEASLLCKRLINSHTIRPMVIGKTKEELEKWAEEMVIKRAEYYKKAHIIIDARNLSTALLADVLNPYINSISSEFV